MKRVNFFFRKDDQTDKLKKKKTCRKKIKINIHTI